MAVQRADRSTIDTYLAHVDRAITMVRQQREVPADLPLGLRPLFNPTVANLLHAHFTTDPAEFAAAFAGPVLLVQGDRDVQVSSQRDTPRLEAALRQRAVGTLHIALATEASHNLKRVTGDADPGLVGPIVPEALEAINRWAATWSAPRH